MPATMTMNSGMKKTPLAGNSMGPGILMRSQTLIFRAVDGTENQYEISFSSETPDARYGTPQILLHTADAVDLSRFDSGVGALLFNHGMDPNIGALPIGKIVKAWIDESTHTGRAVIEMDVDDPQSALLKSKLDKGMLTGVSVRGTGSAWLNLPSGQKSPDGRFTGPADIAMKWTPIEISLTPVPVDPTVGLGRSFMEGEFFMDPNNQAGVTTPQTAPTATAAGAPVARSQSAVPAAIDGVTTPPQGVPVATPPVVRALPADPIVAERQRSSEILTLCRSFGMNDDADGYITSGSPIDAVRANILTKLQQRNSPVAAGAGTGSVQVVRDEMDKLRSAAADGLLMRSGIAVEKPAEGANEFRGMSLQGIAAECLVRSGVSRAYRMGRDELFKRSMVPDSAFVSIANDVANRTVLAAQQTAPTTFQQWTSVASQPDFRPTHIYDVSDGGDLEEIPQNGEFKEAELSDKEVATRRLITVGKMVNFTRQLFINDDIGQITRTLTAYTLAFARGINKSVYEILKSNPAMQDGQQLFGSAHKNLGIGAAPSTVAFSEARRLMRQQTDMDGKTKLNVTPIYVLTGSTTETSIEMLLRSIADPSSNNSGVSNVFQNAMTPIVDAELDVDSGAQPYFFAADPALTPTIEISYLNGNAAPTVESEVAFDHLGIRYRIYGDRGITLVGYRGLVKNPGISQ